MISACEVSAMTQFDVFLSHNSSDKSAVRELKRSLEGYGVSVWLDEDNGSHNH